MIFLQEGQKVKILLVHIQLRSLLASLEQPRKVMLMIKAGKAVDEMIETLIPHLSPGDIIIDGGNTHFPDTNRRTAFVESKGLLYIGTGVSGGEEGALLGPSIMPEDQKLHGLLLNQFFRQLLQRLIMVHPAATGLVKMGQVIL